MASERRLCYNNNNLKTKTKEKSPNCIKCGRVLILIEEKTEKIDNYYFPVTTFTYECSDLVCREDSEKKTIARMKLREEQETSRLNRVKDRAIRVEFNKSANKNI